MLAHMHLSMSLVVPNGSPSPAEPPCRAIIFTAIILACAGLLWDEDCSAGAISIPNSSFESPVVPPVSPYAGPDIDDWEKSPQPSWYDPAQNSNTPWAYLMGQFYNVQFPGQFIDNCDGNQAAFLFALPEAALFQDYDSISGTNASPGHLLNATFNVGSSYDLTVGVLGGGGGMKPGVTLQLVVYYRDLSTNISAVASTVITNSSDLFPTNTHFVDFSVQVPSVKAGDAWAGKYIGIELLSAVGFDLAGGYWDLDNVRLTETSAMGLTLGNAFVSSGSFVFEVQGAPGSQFELQATTSLNTNGSWASLGNFTNATGVYSFTNANPGLNPRFYRVRQL